MWLLTIEWGPDVRGTWRLDTSEEVVKHLAAVCGCKHCAPRVTLRWHP